MTLVVVVKSPRGHPCPSWNRQQKSLLNEIAGSIPVPRRSNSTYSNLAIGEPILRAGLSGLYPSQAASLLRDGGRKVPSPDDLAHRLRQMEGQDVLAWFSAMNRKLVNAAGNLTSSMVALDIHKRPYYGRDRSHAVGMKKHRGTNYAHGLVSIDRLTTPRLTLWAQPVLPMQRFADHIRAGIKAVREVQEIELMLIDSEAYSCTCLIALHELEVPYVIPAPEVATVRRRVEEARNRALQDFPTERGVFWYEHRVNGVPTNLVVVFDRRAKKGYFSFLTKEVLTERRAWDLASAYRMRWGIETGYRMRSQWKITTNCLSYAVRLFLLLFEILLYNLWLLANEAWPNSAKPDRYPISRWRFPKLIFPAG